MILQLRIINFAIIEELQIEFHEGFNVLTGETGAGKSILLDALGVLLGERASADFVRHGQNRAEIEGLFSLVDHVLPAAILNELGIPFEDNMVIIRREITNQGKSTARINGQLVTLSMLKQVGDVLVNFHSQHDHHQLLQENQHLFWLDSYAGSQLNALLSDYKSNYNFFVTKKKEYTTFTQDEKEMAQRIDLIQFQLNEIEQSHLEIGEDEKLMEEKNKQIHAEKIIKNVHGAYISLKEEHKSLDWLSVALSHLEEVATVDSWVHSKFQQMEEAFYILDDIASELNNYHEGLEFDPNRLDNIEDRLHTIYTLKRKYGQTIQDILTHKENISNELDKIVNRDVMIDQLMADLMNTKQSIVLLAHELTKRRMEISEQFVREMKIELNELHMENAQFVVNVKDLSSDLDPTSFDLVGNEFGMNEIEFMISTNPGEPIKSLSKVASGGELSRLALAMRTVLAQVEQVNTLVFDEVDTGVSGRITHAIGEKLLRISKDRQVLAITHHPQVASFADTHFLIEKRVEGNRTKTSISQLTKEEQTLELARMIGGNEVTSSGIAHATELLRLAEEVKRGNELPIK